ncbi:hypothetical protein SKAU_G00150170 [Synaphobranchus kaupii]|uniref:Uncharacterized protein n=1 Tax=Synaphobranchus kaupii TaxID=118154 RepID=A0A9Q1J4V4_SYNKA|nr:hypothetical protein SKAU_G00150170 [Synaphobranchus kaupii]
MKECLRRSLCSLCVPVKCLRRRSPCCTDLAPQLESEQALTLWNDLINSRNISLRVRPSSSWGRYSKSFTSLNLPSCCTLVFMKVYGARLRYFACQRWSCQSSLRPSHSSSTTGPQDRPGPSREEPHSSTLGSSEKFRIPWKKFPSDLTMALQQKKRPAPALRQEMVRMYHR